MEEMNTRLVALEQVASNFSHFIIEHRLPVQAVPVNLHNATCPSCQKADAMADNGHLSPKSKQSGQATLIPIHPPNSQSGEAPFLLSPVPSLISDSSAGSALQYFFAGARQQLQEAVGLSVFIDKAMGSLLSFFGGDESEAAGDEDLSEASEGSGYGSSIGSIPEGSHGCRG